MGSSGKDAGYGWGDCAGAWETFTVVPIGASGFALRTHHGKYLGFVREEDAPMAEKVEQDEVFEIEDDGEGAMGGEQLAQQQQLAQPQPESEQQSESQQQPESQPQPLFQSPQRSGAGTVRTRSAARASTARSARAMPGLGVTQNLEERADIGAVRARI